MASSSATGELLGFNDPVHSNWKLEILIEPSESCLEPTVKSLMTSGEKEMLHINSLVLGKHSDFFRRRIEGWAGDSSEKIIRVTVMAGEEIYLKELVKFMYTEEIPFNKGSDIIKLLLLANELLVPACEAKCMIDLLKEGGLILDDVAELCRTHEHAPLTDKLLSSVESALMDKFGDLKQVWATTELQEFLLRLPLRMIEVLLGSNDLKVTSENTAFTAAAMWVHHNEKELGDEVKAAWGRLQCLLRFVCMTPLFVTGVVAQMPWKWWNEKASVVARTTKLQILSQESWDIYLKGLSSEEQQKHVPRPVSKDFTYYDWKVPVGKLDAYGEGTDTSDSKVNFKYSDPFFCCGYMLQIGMGRQDSVFKIGISFMKPALEFAKFSGNKSADGGTFVEMELMEISVIGSKTTPGSSPAGAERFVNTLNVRHGPLWPGWTSHNVLGITLETGSKLCHKLKEAGYVVNGHLNITAKVLLSMGPAKRAV